MNIETKFDIGQDVYYIAEYYNECDEYVRKIIYCEIDGIFITTTGVIYLTTDGNFYENEIFTTQEEAGEKLKELNL